MNEQERAIYLAGAKLERHRHVCAFFHTRDEEYRVLLPFIKEGIERGEKAFHMVDARLRHEHFQRMAEIGLDVAATEASGQLEVRDWEEAHLRGDQFDQYAMLDLVEEVLTNTKSQGFPLTRWVAHMEWSLEDRPGVNDIVEYETRLNHILPKYPDPVICTYDLAKFSASTVMDILRTHPLVIIGGILQENPFFIPPDEFLQELRRRAQPAKPA